MLGLMAVVNIHKANVSHSMAHASEWLLLFGVARVSMNASIDSIR